MPKAGPTQPWSQGSLGLGLGLGPGLELAVRLTCSGWERVESQMGGFLFVHFYKR